MDPWSRGREVACGVLRSSPKPEKRSLFYHQRGIENFSHLFSAQQRPNVFDPDACPAPYTYHRPFVNIVTRGWAGAPNARAPFRFHGAVVGFVDRCPSRTRNLAASNLSFGRVFLRPILAQHLATKYVFRFFFLSLEHNY